MLWIKFRSETRGYFQILVHTVHTEFAHQIWNVESINIMATKIIQRPPPQNNLGQKFGLAKFLVGICFGSKEFGPKNFLAKNIWVGNLFGSKKFGLKFFWVKKFRSEIWFGQILFCSYKICLCYVADYC